MLIPCQNTFPSSRLLPSGCPAPGPTIPRQIGVSDFGSGKAFHVAIRTGNIPSPYRNQTYSLLEACPHPEGEELLIERTWLRDSYSGSVGRRLGCLVHLPLIPLIIDLQVKKESPTLTFSYCLYIY